MSDVSISVNHPSLNTKVNSSSFKGGNYSIDVVNETPSTSRSDAPIEELDLSFGGTQNEENATDIKNNSATMFGNDNGLLSDYKQEILEPISNLIDKAADNADVAMHNYDEKLEAVKNSFYKDISEKYHVDFQKFPKELEKFGANNIVDITYENNGSPCYYVELNNGYKIKVDSSYKISNIWYKDLDLLEYYSSLGVTNISSISATPSGDYKILMNNGLDITISPNSDTIEIGNTVVNKKYFDNFDLGEVKSVEKKSDEFSVRLNNGL